MARRTVPAFCTALTVLREIRGWTAAELAAAVGVRRSSIVDYERGRKLPSVPTLNRLVAALGYPPKVLDRTLSFVESTRVAGESARGEAGGAGGAQAQIEVVAAEIGWSVADGVRRLLTRLGAEGEALEARRRAPALWARLRPYKTRERRALIKEAEEFHSWALCELLCAESARAAADNAARSVELAELALAVAETVGGAAGWRSLVQGYAWAFLGNARRVAGELGAADEAVGRARELWAAGAAADAGVLDGARLLDLEALVRIDQRRFPEALELLERALAAGRTDETRARRLLAKSKALEEMGEYELALGALRQAAPLLDESGEARLHLVLHFNLAAYLCRLGRAEEAEGGLGELRLLTLQLGNGLDLVRLRWLEGKVAAGLGRLPEAIAAFQEVRARFTEQEIGYDAALVTLELAELLAGAGRTAEVKALSRQTLPVFHALGIHAEAQRALQVFREAAESERLSAELAGRLVAYFLRARHDPRLRFEGAA
jgi:transcriptional regulator with XRE-family HTH domain